MFLFLSIFLISADLAEVKLTGFVFRENLFPSDPGKIIHYFFIFYDVKVNFKTFIPGSRIFDNEDDILIFQECSKIQRRREIIFKKKYYETSTIYECVEK